MENGKRKVREGEEEEEEEEILKKKIDEFYSLLRSLREGRKQLEELQKKQSNHRKINTWVPSFEWEDFATQVEFRKPPLIFPKPQPNKEQHHHLCLDLELSL